MILMQIRKIFKPEFQTEKSFPDFRQACTELVEVTANEGADES